MKLLLLEENSEISNIYEKIFKQKSYQADFVKNEAELLGKYDKNYDYVILEKKDPTLEGSEISESIKRLKPDQKILFLESHFNSKPEISGFLEKNIGIIEKPFSMLTLIAQIELEKNDKTFP